MEGLSRFLTFLVLFSFICGAIIFRPSSQRGGPFAAEVYRAESTDASVEASYSAKLVDPVREAVARERALKARVQEENERLYQVVADLRNQVAQLSGKLEVTLQDLAGCQTSGQVLQDSLGWAMHLLGETERLYEAEVVYSGQLEADLQVLDEKYQELSLRHEAWTNKLKKGSQVFFAFFAVVISLVIALVIRHGRQ